MWDKRITCRDFQGLSLKHLPMRFFHLLLCLFLFSQVQGQVQYVIALERPATVSEEQVLSLFRGNADFSQLGLRDGFLTLVVPSGEEYPILAIREMLATLQVAAKDYRETILGEAQPDARAQRLETSRFRVYGNCGMCEERIQRAARSVKGVVAARWEEESGQLTVKYQKGVAEPEAIHQAIADAGHDTDRIRAKDSVYQDLHHCCKYERPQGQE